MQLYSCIVRLNGEMKNEVFKSDVTAAEIKVLKAIHTPVDAGVESIHSIKSATRVDRDDDEERDRLREIYGEGLSKNGRIGSLERILGFEGTPLPQVVQGVDSLPAPKAGRRAKTETLLPDPTVPVDPIKENEFA